MRYRIFSFSIVILFFLLFFSGSLHAQYFGRNKVQYKNFQFEVFATPHFEIYHYLKNDTLLHNMAQQSERWYRMHQEIFRDSFAFLNPIILYEGHADFQQTTVISGLIGVGTGGVTEGLKNRVVMPVMESNAQTNHVLGHELVHAFQYNAFRTTDSISLNSAGNVPLWMIEGMAEYMSIGNTDANTAMWMRDAVLNKDIPTLRDLTVNPKYFPYRYGQAFWAYATSIWGDTIIKPILVKTAQYGYETAIKKTLHLDSIKTFDRLWKTALIDQYTPYLKKVSNKNIGKPLITEKNAGEMNISPAISPNGRFIAFLSEKELFTIDIFLADAASGKIIRKLSSATQQDHIDALSFIESAGTWAPNSRQFAYVVFSGGKNKLIIADALSGKTSDQLEIPGVSSFSNPAWSPVNDKIVVSGMIDGQTDLFLFDINTKEVTRLTSDRYSDIQPNWSGDGRFIVFSSDRVSLSQNKKANFQMCILDVNTRQITNIDLFPGADNLNPNFSPDSKSVYFLSNRDGFRNMYRYSLETKKIIQLTDYFTGISGITDLSAAISVARQTEKVSYSHYSKNDYSIYLADKSEFLNKEVHPDSVDFSAALLAPKGPGISIVVPNLEHPELFPPVSEKLFKHKAYRPKFQLDYIGNTGVGIAANRFGTGLAGGINMLFSDILSFNQLFVAAALNGRITDIGGQAIYLNQRRKVNFGGSISHIPYQSTFLSYAADTISTDSGPLAVTNARLDYLNVYEDMATVLLFYPLSQSQRFELNTSFLQYSYRIQRINNYFAGDGFVREEREKLPGPPVFRVGQVNAAFVEDNSFFGMTSPLKGRRYRVELGKYLDHVNFYSALADYRRYHFMQPVNFSYRLYHYGRYGRGINNTVLSPLFLGYPTLMRGYDYMSINQLSGNRILVTSGEIRLPFTGPKRLALIKSGYFLTDLALFTDAGIAWDMGNKLAWQASSESTTIRTPVFSSGLSLRINLFGALIVEVYYAIPYQVTGLDPGVFGFNIVPGW